MCLVSGPLDLRAMLGCQGLSPPVPAAPAKSSLKLTPTYSSRARQVSLHLKLRQDFLRAFTAVAQDTRVYLVGL